MPTAFLDYDGTLHDCMRLYGPAFRACYDWLVSEGHAQPRDFSDDDISQWLGWEVVAMWNAFMPELEEPVWRRASRIVGDEMNARLERGEAALFPGIEDALRELRESGWDLAMISNCGLAYRDTHFQLFGLDRYLSAGYCVAEFPGLKKWEIYQQIHDRHAGPHVMVGDRFHDLEVATKNGIPSVGCAWGYGLPGELDCATVVIDSPGQLVEALRTLVE